jgi:hypothetical protein
MTSYLCPQCGGIMHGTYCPLCNAEWGEDHSEQPCRLCGSFEYLDAEGDSDKCPACGGLLWPEPPVAGTGGEWDETNYARAEGE